MRLCATIRARRSLVKPWQSHLSIYATGRRLEFHANQPTRGARHQFAVRAPLPRRETKACILRVGIDKLDVARYAACSPHEQRTHTITTTARVATASHHT